MDRRSWPWKKKSSEKATLDSALATLASAASQGDQDNSQKVKYVEVSVETYAHLTEMENQVKILNDQVDLLNEKFSAAQSEITTKENTVKQHAKVAEEAVSGWEKAEAEALTLKHELESVTLLKLTAEDRASHLDGALKECMKQIRNLKEEHEQKLYQTVLTKTKQWDKVKLEFEAKINDLDQEIRRSAAENAALSRSLQDRSDMVVTISEEKSQAEAEIELLRTEIESCEREIHSLKYELHMASKELEIRNEEKNMSVRSSEVANKQHLEGVRKITKLEAECQRLRGLVRKKLPGPAALAQMKLEVESLGKDYGESRIRRSPVKGTNYHLAPLQEFSQDDIQQFHKETEFLTARLMASDEETKMLKEALATRNSELQASRNMYAKAASKLRNIEAQMQVLNQHRLSHKLDIDMSTKGSSCQNASKPPSLTSMSEDGVDEVSCYSEFWSTHLISELSHFNKDKSVGKANSVDNMNHDELMNDFLEMEKLACSSTESCRAISTPESTTDKRTSNGENNTSFDAAMVKNPPPGTDLDSSQRFIASNESMPAVTLASGEDQVSLSKLRSRISRIFDTEAKDANMEKILEDIKHVLNDIQDTLPQCTPIYECKESTDVCSNRHGSPQRTEENTDSGISLSQDTNPSGDGTVSIEHELATAVSHIHGFVASLGKEAMSIQNGSPRGNVLRQEIETFSNSVSQVLCSKTSVLDFLLDLSNVLMKAGELSITVLGYKGSNGEADGSDCIDKVALLDNKVVQDEQLLERSPSDRAHISHSKPDPEVLQEASTCPGVELKVASSCNCMLELKELKSEKNKLEMDLARCSGDLKQTESQLEETKQTLSELERQLESSQKSNSLAETQLKCMAESYKTLEVRAQNFEVEVNLLRTKVETIDNELQEEKQNHLDTLARCKDLQDQVQRRECCSLCSLSSVADADIKSKQEREIAAAAEKLAECQETIFLLGRQLKTLRPSVEHNEAPQGGKHQMDDSYSEDASSPSILNQQGTNRLQDYMNTEMESVASNVLPKGDHESLSPPDTEAKLILNSPATSSSHPKHRPTKSSSSSSSSSMTPEKNPRSFSRFFSSKSKNGH